MAVFDQYKVGDEGDDDLYAAPKAIPELVKAKEVRARPVSFCSNRSSLIHPAPVQAIRSRAKNFAFPPNPLDQVIRFGCHKRDRHGHFMPSHTCMMLLPFLFSAEFIFNHVLLRVSASFRVSVSCWICCICWLIHLYPVVLRVLHVLLFSFCL